MQLLTDLLVNKEACPLCHQENGRPKKESADEHRARRRQAADAIFADRLRGMHRLSRPPSGIRSERANRRAEDFMWPGQILRFEDLKQLEGMSNLKRRIFRDCPFTRSSAGPWTRQDKADLICLKWLAGHLCRGTKVSACGFIDIDELMAVDTNGPDAVNDL